jgi:hypothetical protein
MLVPHLTQPEPVRGAVRLSGMIPPQAIVDRPACLSPALREVLSRIADHPLSRIEDLLPWNMASDLPRASELS